MEIPRSIDPGSPSNHRPLSPRRRLRRRLARPPACLPTSPSSTFPPHFVKPPLIQLPLRRRGRSLGCVGGLAVQWGFVKSPLSPSPRWRPLLVERRSLHLRVRFAAAAVHFSSRRLPSSFTSKHFVAPSSVSSQFTSWSSIDGRRRITGEEGRLVAEEGTFITRGGSWEKKRTPVAPAAVSSVWARRGGDWFAAVGRMILDSNCFNLNYQGKYSSFQVRILHFTSRQTRVSQSSHRIIICGSRCPWASSGSRLKTKKTGRRRRIVFRREDIGGDVRRRGGRSIFTNGSVCQSIFSSLARAIEPSGELLLGPSRSAKTASSAASLLASSCSGPSWQVEPAPTARQIPCPGIGNDLPLPGRVVFPRALRFPPREKMSTKAHNNQKKLSSVVFLRALRFPH